MRNPKVICYGEVLWDVFPDRRDLGGAISNVAVHLAALGEATLLATRVGTDELGDLAESELRSRGVDTRLVQRDPTRATGEVTVSINEGEPTYKLERERAWERIEATDEMLELISTSCFFNFGSLSQITALGKNSWRRAVTAAQKTPGCALVYDLNFRRGYIDWPFTEEALGLANIIKVNDREHSELQKHFAAKNVVEELLQRKNISLVALTHGHNGCTIVSRENSHIIHPAEIATEGDRVGAGDGFVAGLLFALLRRLPLEKAGAFANKVAGEIAGQFGATPPLSEETLTEARNLFQPSEKGSRNEFPISYLVEK